MIVLVSGAGGMIGSALSAALAAEGVTVRPLSRRRAPGAVWWDPGAGDIDVTGLEGVDAVVHLAGESLDRRWTAEGKRRIRESRTRGTALLVQALLSRERRPRVFVGASAMGYYGDRGDEVLTEESAPGDDFLARVCIEWEAAALPLAAAGIRVAHLRVGLVLSPHAGLLARLLPPFRLGLGGPIGSGRQWWSWITLDDTVGAFRFALTQESVRGPCNAAAPNPVRNGEFAKTLARVLGRPALVRVPALALRLAFGQMADGMMLVGNRLSSAKLARAGYRFRHAALEPALRELLGKA